MTRSAGRTLKPSTLMMGYGYDPVLSEGSLKPPIFLTSTFVFESAEAGKRHFEGITGKRAGGAEGLVYSRFNGPNQEILEDRLSVWDGAEDALVFSSGMTAICILMLAYCEAGDVIVHSGPLYAASEGFVAKVLGKFGVTYLDFPAGATREETRRGAGQPSARPSGRQGGDDLPRKPGQPDQRAGRHRGGAAMRAMPRSTRRRPPIAIDNTFLGPLWQSPLRHGADIVVYSLTKYAGGHSRPRRRRRRRARRRWIDPVRALRNTMGGDLRPQHRVDAAAQPRDARDPHAAAPARTRSRCATSSSDHPKVEERRLSRPARATARQKDIYDRHCTGAGQHLLACSSRAARPRRSASSTR